MSYLKNRDTQAKSQPKRFKSKMVTSSYSSYQSLPPVVYFFQACAPLSIKNAKFWPVLAILLRIYALFGDPFTGLNSVVVPKN